MRESKYYTTIIQLMEEVKEKEFETLEKCANVIAEAIQRGNSLYVFGASHAGILSQELFYRAGGLALWNPLFASEVLLNTCPVIHTTKMESLEGYGTLLAENIEIKKGDVLLLHSVSGRNPLIVELALACRQAGATIIAITSLTYSKHTKSRSKTGKRLFEVSDWVIDNHGCLGDASVTFDQLPQAALPTSTIIGCLLVNVLQEYIISKLLDQGMCDLPIFYSANIDDGAEKNKAVFLRYASQIHYM